MTLLRTLAVACVFLAAALARGAAGERQEQWAVMMLQDQRAGYARSLEETVDGRIRSVSEMKLRIKRGELTIEVSLESEWIETPEGRAVSAKTVANLGAQPITRAYTFTDEGMTVATTQGGKTTTEQRPRPAGDWLPPAAAARVAKVALEKGEKSFTVLSLEDDLLSGLAPVSTTRTVLERTTVDVFGKTVPAVKWQSAIDKYPDLKAVEFVDERGQPLRSEIDLGGLKLVQLAADKALALSPMNPPELLVSTLVTPDRPIIKPRSLREATYVLRVKEGQMPELPSTGRQRVERINDRAARVTVGVEPGEGAAPADAEREAALKPSAMVDQDDPAVRALHAQAPKRGAIGSAERAEGWRRFVHRTIRAKDLSVGLATASETARTKTGDCSEHAVLLAALLRADGIPARVVSGLTYADAFAGQKNVFGYHMWSQALLGEGDRARWVDLDATLGDATPFDATHIALGVTTFSELSGDNPMLTLVPLLGRLEIQVEKSAP